MTTTNDQDSTTEPATEPVKAARPGFLRGVLLGTPDPLDPAATVKPTETEPTPAATTDAASVWNPPPYGPGSGTGSGPDAPPDDKHATAERGSSPASTADLPGLQEIARTLVGMLSLIVRAARRRRRPWLPEHVWLTDEDDQQTIGDPLARIAQRHAPVGTGKAGDVVDGITAAIGVAGYTVKGLEAEAVAADLAPTEAELPDGGNGEIGVNDVAAAYGAAR